MSKWNRRTLPGAVSINRLNPRVFIGDLLGSKIARCYPGAVVVPIDADPSLWRYPFAGLEITLVSAPESRSFADRVARALINDGATLVAACDPEGPIRIFRGAQS